MAHTVQFGVFSRYQSTIPIKIYILCFLLDYIYDIPFQSILWHKAIQLVKGVRVLGNNRNVYIKYSYYELLQLRQQPETTTIFCLLPQQPTESDQNKSLLYQPRFRTPTPPARQKRQRTSFVLGEVWYFATDSWTLDKTWACGCRKR